MTHSDLVRLYGSGSDAAAALGVTRAAVSVWKRRGIPIARQFEIQLKTGGKLKAARPGQVEKAAAA